MNDKRFYTYLHRLVKTMEVICVGSGTKYRMRCQHNRNKKWNTIVKDNAWYFTIVKDGMTKSESEELEASLINIYKPIGNTINGNLASKKLDTSHIDTTYYYDETSPTYLRYKVSRGERLVGDVVNFSTSQSGIEYRHRVPNNGRSILAYRVIWYLCTGQDPVGFLVDHIDGDCNNNQFSNLRIVTAAENRRNVKLGKNNVTGHKGVRLDDIRNTYEVSWYEYNNRLRRCFSISKYGKYLSLALAMEYRHRMVTKYSKTGQGLSDRHIGEYERHPALLRVTEVEIQEMFDCKLRHRNWCDKYPQSA